jgi:hypothetical protein
VLNGAPFLLQENIVTNSPKKRRKTKSSPGPTRSWEIAEIPSKSEPESCARFDIGSVQQEMKKRVIGRALELVDDTLQHIKDGNFQGMKYLFEAVGLLPIKSADGESANSALGKNLSDLLERCAELETEHSVTRDAVP